MLIRKVEFIQPQTLRTDEVMQVKIRKALGDPNPYSPNSFYPQFATLPNLKRITENDFWWSNMHHSAKAEIYVGRQVNKIEIDGSADWRDVILYWQDRDYLANGGHAVLWCYNRKETHYFEWRACDHTFKSQNIGRCLNRYTCTKCGVSHDVDSSD